MPLLTRSIPPIRILPVGSLAFALALLLFAVSRDSLWVIFIVMGLGGLGIGCVMAIIPQLIVSAVPPEETGSAVGLNLVLRVSGYSIGSALSAALLAAFTVAPAEYPTDVGYTVTALVGVGMCVVTAVVSWVVPSSGGGGAARPTTADESLLADESAASTASGLLFYEDRDGPGSSPSAGERGR